MSAISIDQLHHSYTEGQRQHTVLDNITESIPAGQVTALVGQSGSGKSTLLHLLGGLDPVQQGAIKIFDTAINELNDRERTLFRRQHIGFVYQSFNLIPTLTVEENVALPLTMNRVPKSLQQLRVHAVLDSVDLLHRREQFPDRLSGGEQQRIAIARGIVHEPPLILADEPTGNLDATTGKECLQMLLKLVREKNATLLLVTHSRVVAQHADRLLRLEGGKLRAEVFSEDAW
ncbi:MAG: ABC transporter ATP-binding protein [Gammaproteobacteria bacterium]|nr:ABC transporter ATP-binding protein [Gammaproteobacteria bacterium]